MKKLLEALDLALEALELNNDEWKALADSGDCGYWKAEDQDHYKQTNEAITAIKQARSAPVLSAGPITPEMANWSEADKAKLVSVITQHAAPAQEPVKTGDTLFQQFMSEADKAGITHWPTPPAAQPTTEESLAVAAPVQEPVEKYYVDGGHIVYPATQRQWVSLTDEERYDIRASFRGRFLETSEFAEQVQLATEAKLKEKNT
jgi:hypothetical protein